MIRSMTGFGRGSAESDDFHVQVDLRSVNHRFLDLRCRLPFFSPELEARLKETVSKEIHRGKVDMAVNVEEKGERGSRLRVNRSLLNDYVSELRELGSRLNLEGRPGLAHIAGLPWGKVFEIREMEPSTEDLAVFEGALQGALEQMVEMREREGAALQADFSRRLSKLRECIKEVAAVSGDMVPLYREKLRERMQVLTQSQEPSEDRLLQEAAFLADRSDIAEELTRMEGHMDGLAEAFGTGGPVGKKIDFLLQECHREVNTIGSKARGTEISAQVIEAKVLVEAMREQAQNIE